MVHKSYNLTNAEKGDVVSSTQSVLGSRGWILRLIGFFVFCGVVVAGCLLSWNLMNQEVTTAASTGTNGRTSRSRDNSAANHTTVVVPDTILEKGDTVNQEENPPVKGRETVITQFNRIVNRSTESTTENSFVTDFRKVVMLSELDTTTVTTSVTDTTVISTSTTDPTTTSTSVEDKTNATTSATDTTVISTSTTDPTTTDTTTLENTTNATASATHTMVISSSTTDPTTTDTTTVEDTTNATASATNTTVISSSTTDPTTTDTTTVEDTTNATASATNTTVISSSTTDPTTTDTTTVEDTTNATTSATDTTVIITSTTDPTTTDTTTVEDTTNATTSATDTTVISSSTTDPTTTDTTTVEDTTNATTSATDTTVISSSTTDLTTTDTTTVEDTTNATASATHTTVISSSTTDPTTTDTTTVEDTTNATASATHTTVISSSTSDLTTTSTSVEYTTNATTSATDTTVISTSTTDPTTTSTSIEDTTNVPTSATDTTLITTSTTDLTTTSTSVEDATIATTSAMDTTTITKTETTEQIANRVAKRMRSYMNQSTEPCDDFYEYACGNFQADHQISETDLTAQATKRIFDQAKNGSQSVASSRFLQYYNSCMNYENEFNMDKRIELAQNAIAEIGTFKDKGKSPDHFDFTEMLSKLFLRDSALLFDIIPELEVGDMEHCGGKPKTTKFVMKLVSPVLKRNLFVNETDECYDEQKSAMQRNEVNLGDLYNNYTDCREQEFLKSIETAVRAFPTFSPYVDDVKSSIQKISDNFRQLNPAMEVIRKAEITKDYAPYTVQKIQKKTDWLKWSRLFTSLTNTTVNFELRIHDSRHFVPKFNVFKDMDKSSLNNALLGFYTYKIYNELVVPGRDEHYCKRIAVSLMEKHAASLYMSSFSDTELADLNAKVTKMFEDLRTTLESGVKKASWLQHHDETEIMKKIRNLTIALPDKSYYQEAGTLNPESSDIQEKLTGNFFKDTMALQYNIRKSMYRGLEKSVIDYDEIWTRLAQPHQTSGSVIHGFNKIILPYGAIDWQILQDANKISSPHLALATLGTGIAQEIAHHFDSTGRRYSVDRKISKDQLFCKDTNATTMFENYIKQHKLPNKDVRNIPLPFTGQNIQYKISDLSSDERISENIGLQIAHDTILRMWTNSSKLLPWPTEEKTDKMKQFFLAYTQIHCTKKPLTSSFVSLNENEHLPSRLRISVVASSNKFFRDSWQCSNADSQSEKIISAFPNVDIRLKYDGQPS